MAGCLTLKFVANLQYLMILNVLDVLYTTVQQQSVNMLSYCCRILLCRHFLLALYECCMDYRDE